MSGNKEQVTQDNAPVPVDDKDRASIELIAGIKGEKKRLFLENYHKCNFRTKYTAQAIGVDESTVYNWMKNDPAFAQAFQVLKKELDAMLIEDYLANIREIAFDKNTPPQSRLLGSFFELKALDARYRDRAPDRNVNIREIVVHSAIPWPVYPEIEGEYTEEIESAST